MVLSNTDALQSRGEKLPYFIKGYFLSGESTMIDLCTCEQWCTGVFKNSELEAINQSIKFK